MLLFASPLTAALASLGLALTVFFATRYANATDGLTFVVLVLTGYLVLTEPKRRLEQRELFWRYLADAVYEAVHNLQHIAKAYRPDDSLKAWPQFHVRAALRLIDPPFNDYMLRVEPRLWPHLDHMVRNDEYLQRFPFTEAGANDAVNIVGYFVEHCVRFVIAASRASENKAGPYVIDVIEKLGRPFLTQLVLTDSETKFHVRMSAEVAAADVRDRNYNLAGTERQLHWFGDKDDSAALSNVFLALEDPPPRPGFTESVIRV